MQTSLASLSSGVLHLESGHARAQLAPRIGGAIAGFHWELARGRIDWLRPASKAALAAGDPEGMACFPLVPYSNRVRGGRFHFGARDVALPVNPLNPHFEHGHGWRAAWDVQDASADCAVLRYDHAADAWPWVYRAEQHVVLTPRGLSVTLVITNRANEAMPCGFGLHPYFPRARRTALAAQVGGIWETDTEILPLHHAPCPRHADPVRGICPDEIALDNVFTGWDGKAEVVWPERHAALTLEADAPLRNLVLYTPAGADYFCAEPVSNITDAFNSTAPAGETGLIALPPGQSASAVVRFIPKLTSN